MSIYQRIFTIFLIILTFTTTSYTQEQSPNDPWTSSRLEVLEKEEPTTLTKVLLYLPNRILDLIDIFRLDVGVGPSTGVVARVSSELQAGYRTMHPASLRVGTFGRDYPWMLETSSEFGVTPAFVASKDRDICRSEIGAGLDVFIVGAYGGICLQEVFDFLAGIFLIDLNQDDLK